METRALGMLGKHLPSVPHPQDSNDSSVMIMKNRDARTKRLLYVKVMLQQLKY